jgi:hypothetical protein
MFVSVSYLRDNLGVDETIARFFVDRKVPQGNAFWRNRLLYVGWGNGFVSIPVYYDLLFRVGVPKEVLLAEEHVRLMENVMNYAIQVEFREISFEDQLQKIDALFSGSHNKDLKKELLGYLQQDALKPVGRLGLTSSALNRADVFLFILCGLPMSTDQTAQAIRYWYALHPTYLLMDDMMDYSKDKDAGEENAILELGEGSAGFAAAFGILESNIETLREINPVLSHSLEERMEGLHDLIV